MSSKIYVGCEDGIGEERVEFHKRFPVSEPTGMSVYVLLDHLVFYLTVDGRWVRESYYDGEEDGIVHTWRIVDPVGTISRRNWFRGQFFPQFLRRQLEEFPEAQGGKLQAQQSVRRLALAAAESEAVQVPVQSLQIQ